jgi:uncharacterized membrane protein
VNHELRESATATQVRTLVLTSLFALVVLVLAWNLHTSISLRRLAIAAVLTVPLWLPVRGLLQRQRRTYAWATLCVIPYLVLGVTEAIANSNQRLWAGACLAISFALFLLLIAYLRVTRPAT